MPTRTNFQQDLVGVFGDPVAENPTQVMIEAAFQDMGLDWRYLTVHVRPADLPNAVRGVRAMNWKGFNCTIPHKVAVLAHLDRLNHAAEIIGAVNCVINHQGTLIGDNTDGKGFLQSLAGVRAIRGLNGVILGAGGAARAIAVELGLSGARRLTIVNRTPGRAEMLAWLVKERTPAIAEAVPWIGPYAIPDDVDLVVNATPIGLYPDVDALVPVDPDTLRPGLVVCDVIPNPPRTRLLKEADSRGCIVLDGLGMLVNQGVIGIRLWAGCEPNPVVMRQALEDVFSP